MIKVRSLFAAIACENKEKNASNEQIIQLDKVDRTRRTRASLGGYEDDVYVLYVNTAYVMQRVFFL